MAVFTGAYNFGLIPNNQDISVGVIGLLASIFSSTLPDLDVNFGHEFHRKFTHSILACIIFSAVLLPLIRVNILGMPVGFSLYTGLITGYYFHVLADAFTDNGVCLFWPEKKKILITRLWYYNEGASCESITRAILIIAVLFCWARMFLSSFNSYF